MKLQLEKLFESIDNKNTEDFVSFLSEDCEFIFGNAPSVSGKKGIYDLIDNFFKSIGGLKHTIDEVVEKDNTIISWGSVLYTRLDGNKIPANFCNVFKTDGGLVKKYQIFVDISELYK